ncbi:hypothetical protein [Bradyrhizobium sp. USDA 4520]
MLPNVIVAFSMYFPASEFVLEAEQRPKRKWKDVQFIPTAADGFTNVVSLCITDAQLSVEHSSTSSELGVFDLSEGKCVRLIAHDVLDTDVTRAVNEIHTKVANTLQAQHIEMPSDGFGYFLGHRTDGVRNLIGVKWPRASRSEVGNQLSSVPI